MNQGRPPDTGDESDCHQNKDFWHKPSSESFIYYKQPLQTVYAGQIAATDIPRKSRDLKSISLLCH
jgi:hypothetical protein